MLMKLEIQLLLDTAIILKIKMKSTFLAKIGKVPLKYRMVDNRRHYDEQRCIIEQRHSYLHRMITNRTDNRPEVYFDETWANAHGGKVCAWVERDLVTGGTLGV